MILYDDAVSARSAALSMLARRYRLARDARLLSALRHSSGVAGSRREFGAGTTTLVGNDGAFATARPTEKTFSHGSPYPHRLRGYRVRLGGDRGGVISPRHGHFEHLFQFPIE